MPGFGLDGRNMWVTPALKRLAGRAGNKGYRAHIWVISITRERKPCQINENAAHSSGVHTFLITKAVC